MNKTFKAIITSFLSTVTLLGAKEVYASNVFPSSSVFISNSDSIINIDETRNRLPAIITDAKLLMSEVVISDFNKDTLEVAYLLSKIFELLMEADQIGDMNLEDQEEFGRFEKSFLDVYTHKLVTIKSSDAPVTAERFRRDITEALEPLEIEMGDRSLMNPSKKISKKK